MSLVEYRPELIEEIAARLALRDPNRRALDAVARVLGETVTPGIEVVCDLATATGKSYIAGGLVDYLAASGIRNVAIVCHRTAILTKTRRNFTPGDRKYIGGLDARPMIVTADDFSRSGVRQAIDAREPLLFLFNVQQLLAPRGTMRRRVRGDNEDLGGSLYDLLENLEDLVVIADEHHCYYGTQFSRAVRDLTPLALVGLTATPHPDTPAETIRFKYPLAEAIADGFVKVPVLVGRRDGNDDIRRILRDAVRLLDLKQQALDTWQETGAEPVRAVMFLVCERIDEAEQLATMLADPAFLGEPEQVLTIHSNAPDDALEALERVEEPDSPVRAVVSVQMLQEGWDVKNIYVVVTTRALESKALTEQILGRGLRLPFGTRTGRQMLDTVEVLSHSRFRELLDRAGAMLEAFFQEGSGDDAVELQLIGTTDAPMATTGRVDALVGHRPPSVDGLRPDPDATEVEADSFGMEIVDAETRVAEADAEAAQLSQLMHMRVGTERFRFPRLHAVLRPTTFTLSEVDERDAEAVGVRFKAELPSLLKREVLDVERVKGDGRRNLRVNPHAAEDAVEATQLPLGLDELRARLRRRILDASLLERTRREANAVERLIGGFLRGAGVTDENATWGEARVDGAVDAFLAFVRLQHQHRPSTTTYEVDVVDYPRVGVSLPGDVHHRTSAFVRSRWYDGWTRSVLPVVRFDARSTEREFAELVDADREVSWWTRVETHQEARIDYDGHVGYYPDFLVRASDGVCWVVECKADNTALDPDVLAKKAAAERWARYVNDSGDAHDEWHYLFVTESDIKAAGGSWRSLLALARSGGPT